jgi:hypothetical protein
MISLRTCGVKKIQMYVEVLYRPQTAINKQFENSIICNLLAFAIASQDRLLLVISVVYIGTVYGCIAHLNIQRVEIYPLHRYNLLNYMYVLVIGIHWYTWMALIQDKKNILKTSCYILCHLYMLKNLTWNWWQNVYISIVSDGLSFFLPRKTWFY